MLLYYCEIFRIEVWKFTIQDKEIIIDAGSGNVVNIFTNDNGPIISIGATGSPGLNYLNLFSYDNDSGGAIINNGVLILKDVDVFEREDNSNPEGLILNSGQMIIWEDNNIRKE